MGYGDWTQIEIKNNSNLNGKTIDAGQSYTVGSCGRENTWSGCQGQFDLYDGEGGATATTIKFYSPHGTSYNSFSMDTPTAGWYASQTGAYLGNDGLLGAVTVTIIFKK
ncbi:Aegerolysin [Cladorrhinum sp. PSN259]|nr:Aegerolysin [Cladorrhinum sp. PSN259]